MKYSFMALIFMCCLINNGCTNEKTSKDLLTLQGETMGTTYAVKVVRNSDKINYDSIKQQIDVLLGELNNHLSTYIKDSELSLFNSYQKTDWFTVSEDLAVIMSEAKRLGELSGGVFDITIGPLVNLWGFGPELRPIKIPSAEEISHRKAVIGLEKLEIRLEPPALKKAIPELYCDLSAIAKGFGVDRVAEYLDSIGCRNFLVEIGGEVRTKGNNHQGKKWAIGIASPDENRSIQKVLRISNLSMATSGDYRNYFEQDGHRYSHIIDPRTGRPISHKLLSVTVIHESCMTADGLATAISVMGPEKGFDFALDNNIALYIIEKAGENFIEKKTPAFDKNANISIY
jgi:thiamine biosynthesis lipoprotein